MFSLSLALGLGNSEIVSTSHLRIIKPVDIAVNDSRCCKPLFMPALAIVMLIQLLDLVCFINGVFHRKSISNLKRESPGFSKSHR